MDREVKNFNVRLRTIKLRELVIGIIIALVLSGVLMIFFPILDENNDLFMIVFLLLILLFFIWALKGTTGLSSDFNEIFLKENKNEILYVFLLNIIFAFLFVFLIALLDMLIGFTDPTWISIFDIDSVDLGPSAFFFSIISSIIFAPLLEELVFRGVLFNRLKIRTGIIPAMIISSFLFAIGHDFGGITSAFLFGLCMCILYLKTDNILIPMNVHFINNVVAVIIEYVNADAFLMSFPLIFVSGLIILIATIYLIKYIIEETKLLKNANA